MTLTQWLLSGERRISKVGWILLIDGGYRRLCSRGLCLAPTEITYRGFMINVCYNSDCRKELHYLRDGRVVRMIHGNGDKARLEHFWLCGPCSSEYDFVFGPDGSVSLKHRPGERSALAAA